MRAPLCIDDPAKFVVECLLHSCKHEVVATGDVTRDSLLAWLQRASEFDGQDGHNAALTNILAPGTLLPSAEPPPPPPPMHQESSIASDGLVRQPPLLPRQCQRLAFGPWSISRVEERGVFVAWGGNCNKHTCGMGRRCKRQVTFRGGRVSEPDARCRIKAWLLAGAAIESNNSDSKDRHFSICPYSLPLRPEHELDAEAAALV